MRAADYYVSPTGSASGDGSIAHPWDLFTAFEPGAVSPGDTIWLRGGIYVPANPSWPSLECNLQGTANAPIIVRAYPDERPIFQEHPQHTGPYGQTILYQASGGYVWFWGLEIRSTNTTIHTSTDPLLPNSVLIAAPGVKLINLVIHDTRGGVGMFSGVNSEAYGCVIYNNGWVAPDRGHGHGIYPQNLNGVMHLSDNIIFNQFGLGIHGYTEGSSLKHFLVERNVVFNNSRIGQYPDIDVKQQILFGGGPPIQDLKLLNNYIYLPLGFNSTLMKLDYAASSNDNTIVANNYVAGGSGGGNYAVSANAYQSVLFTNNTIYTSNGYILRLGSKPGYVVDDNTYYGNSGANFNNNSTQYAFAGWQAAGFDSHSSYLPNAVPPDKAVVIPNAYEAKRANIVVYNWSNADVVTVDVSGILSVGDPFEVRNAQDYFAPAVLAGTYTGSPLSLPMTNLTVAIPTGWTNTNAVPTTGKQFNVFVLIGSATTAPPQITQQPANQTVLPGQPATFTVSATGTPSLNYQWQRNNSNISGATSASYTLSNPTLADDGATFRCVVSNAYNTATSSAATLTVINPSAAPVIVAGPAVTNALVQVGNLAAVDSGVTAWLRVDAASGGSALSYQWTFGDGTVSGWLSTNITSHTYGSPTDCGSYDAIVTVSDGTAATSTNLTVAIPDELNVTKLQAKLNFAKPDSDSCSLTATFATCPGFDAANRAVVVDIGGAQVSFALDDKGRGRTGPHSCRVTYNNTGLWTFTTKLKNGAWQTSWNSHGLHNATIAKPGVAVTMPVVLVVGDEAFAAAAQLIYSAKANKSGSAR